MGLTLLTAGLLSIPTLPATPKPAPELPFTGAFVRDGKLVLVGKEFHATAHRFIISSDGKILDLRGTDAEPATRSSPNGPRTRAVVSGKRIVFSPSEGTMRVEDAGKTVTPSPPVPV